MRPVVGDRAAVETIWVPPSVSAYCRQARRLRGTLAHQPARMHRKLRELSVRPVPVAISNGATVARESRPIASKAQAFAERVAAGLDGPVLRYATRRTLLRDAGRMGIGTFEANLIIAAVQHERQSAVGDGAESPPPVPQEQSPAGRLTRFGPVLVIFLLEAVLALGAWRIFGA